MIKQRIRDPETKEIIAYEWCEADPTDRHPWRHSDVDIPDKVWSGVAPYEGIREQFIGQSRDGLIDLYFGDTVRWDDASGGNYWRIADVIRDVLSGLPILRIDLPRCIECSPNNFGLGNFAYWPYTDKRANLFEIIGSVHDKVEVAPRTHKG